MTRVVAGIVVVLALSVLTPITPQAASTQPDSRHADSARLLDPLPPTMSATVDVNVLFIGFDRGTYYDNPDAPLDGQKIYTDVLAEYYPAKSDPIMLGEYFITGTEASADHHLEYKFRPHFASKSLENRFFEHVRRIGRPGPRAFCQTLYNDQETNARDVPDEVLFVSGAAAEQWLLREVRQTSGLKSDGYTLVFINWARRPDFRFHVYTGEGVDPDTGLDGSVDDFLVAGLAWGGTHGRLWFYDFSAGPDCASGNYDVDNYEAAFGTLSDGPDGYIDYRIPPIWDMRADGPEWLYNDVTTAAGYVLHFATHLLFTASAQADPLTSVPAPGGRRLLRLNYFDGDPTVASSEILKPKQVVKDILSLQPYVPTRAALTERPLVGESLTTFFTYTLAFSDIVYAPGCWEPFGDPIFQLYCYLKQHEAELAAPLDPGDAVVPLLLFNITDETFLQAGSPISGIWQADPVTGKSSHVFGSSAPLTRSGWLSGGMTLTVEHELGHFVGLSHEHDGWNGTFGYYINPMFQKWLWALDECHCTMGYLYERAGFGVFERDNVARTLAARAYAETLRLLESEPAWVRLAAGVPLRLAWWSFEQMDWQTSVRSALAAYDIAMRWTGRAQAETTLTAQRVQQPRRGPHLADAPLRLEDQPELQRFLARQTLGHTDPLLKSERFEAMPGIVQRAIENPLLRRYFEASGAIKP